MPVADEALEGAFAAADIVDPETGEVILEANEELTPRVISMAQEKKVERIEVFFPERDDVGPIISQTLKKDPIRTHEEALIEIYRRLRPGDPPTLDSSRSLFENMFFNPQKYDFSRVGRLKLNTKLGLKTPLDEKILHPQDFYEVLKYQLKLRKNPQNVDDIDHLGNRRVRSVGELLENQFRIGLVRMERAIKEKMSVYQEMATAMPHDLINAKPVMAAIREFFGSSQLSQFMDQTNPLSEITHKRRLSALGPGGLSRERAGFEVRDVHPTHYGRICPIETPEGPNIGLISSLVVLRAHQRVRLHRVALPQGQGRPRRRLRDRHQRRRQRRSTRPATSSRPTSWSAPTAGRRRRASSSSPTPTTCRRGKRTTTSSRRRTRRSTRTAASCRTASTRAAPATSSWRRATRCSSSTSRRSSSSRSPPRSCRSSRTTTRTAR